MNLQEDAKARSGGTGFDFDSDPDFDFDSDPDFDFDKKRYLPTIPPFLK